MLTTLDAMLTGVTCPRRCRASIRRGVVRDPEGRRWRSPDPPWIHEIRIDDERMMHDAEAIDQDGGIGDEVGDLHDDFVVGRASPCAPVAVNQRSAQHGFGTGCSGPNDRKRNRWGVFAARMGIRHPTGAAGLCSVDPKRVCRRIRGSSVRWNRGGDHRRDKQHHADGDEHDRIVQIADRPLGDNLVKPDAQCETSEEARDVANTAGCTAALTMRPRPRRAPSGCQIL